MEHVLVGRGAVVVGGSRGVGLAVAKLLTRLGAGVVVNGRDADAVAAAVDAMDGAVGFSGSPTDEATAEGLIGLCLKHFGQIDILVNCAGIAEPTDSSILTVTGAQFDELMASHIGTAFHTCRAAAPHMVGQSSGAIVNTSSFAYLGDYGGTGYPAGKGAVNGFTMAIAAELKEHGVRANVVCPGARTRLSTGADYEDQIRALHRRGLLDEVSMHGALDPAPPDYVAALYGYLVSDLARDVTGQILIGAGNFVGRFDRPRPVLLGYRDHASSPPWSLDELHAMVTG
ncbi:SDR family NAD(P)-dependent oxidoreductase [Mycobacterium sp. MS1601]|uniref:SDR family NAD(P)-dependent oxidoreductase n=1 Tax=Mycobacterium sp. MS1601 TaxID=1936029 RepID=UPI0012F98FC1|nr:SDR family oxidoreductase [Mycobacterium sp. MS1601]